MKNKRIVRGTNTYSGTCSCGTTIGDGSQLCTKCGQDFATSTIITPFMTCCIEVILDTCYHFGRVTILQAAQILAGCHSDSICKFQDLNSFGSGGMTLHDAKKITDICTNLKFVAFKREDSGFVDRKKMKMMTASYVYVTDEGRKYHRCPFQVFSGEAIKKGRCRNANIAPGEVYGDVANITIDVPLKGVYKKLNECVLLYRERTDYFRSNFIYNR
jgi:hypothetical protein